MAKKTAKQQRQYGTASYGPKILARKMRAYAAAERRYKLLSDAARTYSSASSDMHTKHGEALGAISALYSTGCITTAQYDQAFRWLTRINHAKVTRRPFVEVRRAA